MAPVCLRQGWLQFEAGQAWLFGEQDSLYGLLGSTSAKEASVTEGVTRVWGGNEEGRSGPR